MQLSALTQRLHQWFSKLFRQTFGIAAALTLFSMMLITFVDVVGRTFLSQTLPGGFELTELMLAALIFLALPLVTIENAHVEVDLMDSFVPQRLRKLQNIFIRLVNLTALGVLSWMMLKLTLRLHSYEDTTAILEVPLYWLTAIMTLTCALSTLSLLVSPLNIAANNAPIDNEY